MCVRACVFVFGPCFCVEVYGTISVLAIILSRKIELVALLALWLSVLCRADFMHGIPSWALVG